MSLPEDLKKTYVSDLEAGIIANLIKPKVAIVGRSDTGKSTLLLHQFNREFRCGMRNRYRQGTKPQEYWTYFKVE